MRRDLDDIGAIYDHCERHSEKIKKKVRQVSWIVGLSLLVFRPKQMILIARV